MIVVILAGGKGSRISEYTKILPKPMIKIGSKPILEHIINYYIKFGFNDFIIASGYKHRIIKNYFKKKNISAKINVINTGIETLTGSRLKRLSNYLKDTFMLTYGDGLSNENLKKLLNFHKKNRKKITLTAVHPPARFGELTLLNNLVARFDEKPQLTNGWINGGFFVCNRKIFSYLENDSTILEREPFEMIANESQMMAYKHDGFWQCMDTKRDKDLLDKMIYKEFAPWIKS